MSLRSYRQGLRKTLHNYRTLNPIEEMCATAEEELTPLLPPCRNDFVPAFTDDHEDVTVKEEGK